MRLNPVQDSTQIEIVPTAAAIGACVLWAPEAIVTNTGVSAVYPVGQWQVSPEELRQRVPATDSVGPGNFPRIDAETFECCGVRVPADNPVEWETRVAVEGDGVSFAIRFTNLGTTTMRKAGAAVCFKFLNASWWSEETTFARVNGKAVSLAELGRGAGQSNRFQAYLLKGQTFDNVFYREIWGFNERQLDTALLVSENAEAGLCVGIECEAACFMHSNAGNPCTDAMLAFGDVRPGQSATACGAIWVRSGRAQDQIR